MKNNTSLIFSITLENQKKYIAMIKLPKDLIEKDKKYFIDIAKGGLEISKKEIESYKNSCLSKYFEVNNELPIFFDSTGVIDINLIKENIKTFSFENCGKFSICDKSDVYHSLIIDKSELDNLFIFRKINDRQIQKIQKVIDDNNLNKIKIILDENFDIFGYGTNNNNIDSIIKFLN